MNLSQIRNLIANNKTLEAINELKEVVQNEYRNEIIMIESQFKHFGHKSRIGLLENSVSSIQLNKINYQILNLCNELDRTQTKNKIDIQSNDYVGMKRFIRDNEDHLLNLVGRWFRDYERIVLDDLVIQDLMLFDFAILGVQHRILSQSADKIVLIKLNNDTKGLDLQSISGELNKLISFESEFSIIDFNRKRIKNVLEKRDDFRLNVNDFYFRPHIYLISGMRNFTSKKTLMELKKINLDHESFDVLTYDGLFEKLGLEKDLLYSN